MQRCRRRLRLFRRSHSRELQKRQINTMQRRVRPALLVALAALAGCSLAAPGGSTCINSCYCHSSGSTGSPPLISASPPPLHSQGQDGPTDCKHCTLKEAMFGALECPQTSALGQAQQYWDNNERNIKFEEPPVEKNDPCRDHIKYLWITTAATEDGGVPVKWKAFTSEDSLDMTACCLDYPPPVSSHRSTPGHECLGNVSKLD